MIKLSFPTDPYWLELPHDVRVFVRPLTTAVYEAARAKGWRLAGEALAEHTVIEAVGGTVDGLPDLADNDGAAGLSQFVFAVALAQHAIIEWDGVLDEALNAVEAEPENVQMFMSLPKMAEAFVSKYCATHDQVVQEGNVSGSAPNGISATDPTTAGDAATAD